MKIEKFLCNTLKAILKEKECVRFWGYKERVAITYDGYSAIVIPQSINPFAYEIQLNKNLISCDWDCNIMNITDTVLLSNKRAYRRISCNMWDTYIDESFLKIYGLNVIVYQPRKNGTVYMSEDGELCGIIMPSHVCGND